MRHFSLPPESPQLLLGQNRKERSPRGPQKKPRGFLEDEASDLSKSQARQRQATRRTEARNEVQVALVIPQGREGSAGLPGPGHSGPGVDPTLTHPPGPDTGCSFGLPGHSSPGGRPDQARPTASEPPAAHTWP